MNDSDWLHRRGSLARDGWESVVDGALPGWEHTGIRIGSLAGGEVLHLPAESVERMIVPLDGDVDVGWRRSRTDHGSAHLVGRASVFHGPADVMYLGIDTEATLTGTGRVAIAEAPTERRINTSILRAEDIPVEIRGAGRSTRQVHNFGVPGALDAQKLIVCEVITPAENWSSYPAHKHDQAVPGHESRLEEIYYFESAVSRNLDAPNEADPFGMFSTYSSPAGDISIDGQVRSGDIALVPFGYHGPAVAAPGYDLYYLNVMAGPDPERAWLISDDPAHAWIRNSWVSQQPDPRLPYTS
jgi:5-deoxy-glucuronate isomerase